MGLVPSTTYLALFSAGTAIGATSTYFLLKYLKKLPTNNKVWEKGMEQRFEFEEPTDEYRLVMGVRNDLKMQKGKVAAQCGHAAVAAYAKALEKRPQDLKRWLRYGGTKITVRVDSEEELVDLERRARAMNVLSSVIRDAGHTQVAPGSKTVIAVGPAPKSVLDQISGHLKLY